MTFCRIPWCYQCDKIWEVMGDSKWAMTLTNIDHGRNFHDNQHVTLLKPFGGFVTNAKIFHTNIRVLPLAFGSCCSIEGALRLNVMVVYHVLLRRSQWRYRKSELKLLGFYAQSRLSYWLMTLPSNTTSREISSKSSMGTIILELVAITSETMLGSHMTWNF